MDPNLHEQIRRRAYELWEQEGRPEGQALDHWHRAEAETAAAHPGAGGRTDQGERGPAPSAPAMGSSDGARAVPPGSEAGSDAASAAVKGRARHNQKREREPSDLAADEAARGGGGVGP